MGIEEQSAVVDVWPLLDFYIHLNGPTQGHLIDFRFMCNMLKHHTRVYNVAMPLDRNFLIIAVWNDRKQSAVSPQKNMISLKFEHGRVSSMIELAYQPYIFLEKVPYGGFSQIRSHIYMHITGLSTHAEPSKGVCVPPPPPFF